MGHGRKKVDGEEEKKEKGMDGEGVGCISSPLP